MTRAGFKYSCSPWDETIHATKEQLQSFGIGEGLLFPGEQGGPKRAIIVTDPRGYKAEIREYVEGRFIVDITYPGREYHHMDHTPALPNLRALQSDWVDEYVGTAEALIAAGLVRCGQLPGLPGGPKMRTTVLADGTVAKGSADWRAHFKEGNKQITKVSKSTFRIAVTLSDSENQRRQTASIAHRREWEAQWMDAPCPAPLHTVYREMHRLAMLPREPRRSETAEKFKASLSGMAEVYMRALRIGCEDATYRITPESLTVLEQAAEQIKRAIRNAFVIPVGGDGAEVTESLHNGFWLRTAGTV